MEKKVKGTVVSVKKQWWFKVNTKPMRTGPLDGAVFPHIVKVKYVVDGNEIIVRKWWKAGLTPPTEEVTVIYQEENPKKIRLERR